MKKKLLALLALMTCASMTLATGCDAFGGLTSISGAPSSSVEDVGSENSDSTVNSSIDDESSSNEENSSGGETEESVPEFVTDIGTLVTDAAREEEIFQAIVAAYTATDHEADYAGSYTAKSTIWKLANAEDLNAPENWRQEDLKSYDATTGEGFLCSYMGFNGDLEDMGGYSRDKYTYKIFKEDGKYYNYFQLEYAYNDGEEVVVDTNEDYMQYPSAEKAWDNVGAYLNSFGTTSFNGIIYADSATEYRSAFETVYGEAGFTTTTSFYENNDFLTIKIANSHSEYENLTTSFDNWLTIYQGEIYATGEAFGNIYIDEDYSGGDYNEYYVWRAFDKTGFDAIETELPGNVPVYQDPEYPEQPEYPKDPNMVTVYIQGIEFFEDTWYISEYDKTLGGEMPEGYYATPKYFREMFMGFEGYAPYELLQYYDIVWYLDAEYTQSLTGWVESKEGYDDLAVFEDWDNVTEVYGKIVLKDGANITHFRVSETATIQSVEGAHKIVFGDTTHTHEADEYVSWESSESGMYVFECDMEEYTVYVNGEVVDADSIFMEAGKSYDILYVGTADASYCDCYAIGWN